MPGWAGRNLLKELGGIKLVLSNSSDNSTNGIDVLIENAETDIKGYKFDPLTFEEKAKGTLQEIYGSDGEYGLTGEKKKENPHTPYKKVAIFLFRNGYRSLAVDFLAERWEELGRLQEDKHVYRASLSMQLAEFYLELKDEGAALRWLLLTYADDLLHGNGRNKGAGVQKLRAILGMSQLQLEEFANIAEDNKNIAKETRWGVAEGFAEDVVLQFAVENTDLVHLFAKTSSVTEFPISENYLSKLIDLAAEDNPNNSHRQGKQLEYLAIYLILLIPSWVPLRNTQDSKKTFENDIVVRNYNLNAMHNLLGEYFLIECKNKHRTTNQTGTVNSSDVGYFLYRMGLTNCKFGMIFTWEGISGQTKSVSAEKLIERGFDKDGSTCIVLKEDDYRELAKGSLSFLGLLAKLIEEFRFGSQKESKGVASELQSVKGIGKRHEGELKDIGIHTLAELCEADPADIAAKVHGIGEKEFKGWQEQARCLVNRSRSS
jgi:hypothetical protein